MNEIKLVDEGAESAQGTYTYFLNDEPAHIEEPWSIFDYLDGRRVTRAARAVATAGAYILLEATERNGRISEFEIQWRHNGPHAARRAHAHYHIKPDAVLIERKIEEREPLREQLTVSADLIVSPLMRVFQGRVIRQAARLGGGQPVSVLAPWILDPSNRELLLSGILDHRSAKALGAEVVTIGERTYHTEKYQYVGGNYDDAAEFWIDAHDILLRYCWRQDANKLWDVRLTEYERK